MGFWNLDILFVEILISLSHTHVLLLDISLTKGRGGATCVGRPHYLCYHVFRHVSSIFNCSVLTCEDMHLRCGPGMSATLHLFGRPRAYQNRVMANHACIGVSLGRKAFQDAVMRHQDFACALEQDSPSFIVDTSRQIK
jgi:hypothetical protein